MTWCGMTWPVSAPVTPPITVFELSVSALIPPCYTALPLRCYPLHLHTVMLPIEDNLR